MGYGVWGMGVWTDVLIATRKRKNKIWKIGIAMGQ